MPGKGYSRHQFRVGFVVASKRICWGGGFGGILALVVASCRFAIRTGENELTSILTGLPPLFRFMPMNRNCGC